MNRLKYVLGIHVPHRVPSNVYRRHHSDARLLKPTRLFSPRTKRHNEFRSLHDAGQQRNGIIFPQNYNRPKSTSSSSKKTSLERNFPVACVYKDRNLTCQLAKAPSSKRSAGKSKEKVAESLKDVKNSKLCEMKVIETLVVKEPRSYAQMIASYNEAMYAQSGSDILKDCASLTTFNGIRRSPFSTASAVSLKWKSKDKASKKATFRAAGSGALQQEAKFSSSGAFVTRYDCRNDHRSFVQAFGGNTDLERASSSYATMIEKYSNAMNVSVDPSGYGNNVVPRRNVSTKFNDASMTFLDNKDNDRASQDTPGNARSVSKSLTKDGSNDVEKQGQVGWITKMEDVIKDLKRITGKKDETEANEKLVLQSVNERAHWLDRVVTAHKKRMKDRKPMSGKTMVQAKVNESFDVKESTSRKDTVIVAPKENHSPINQAPQMAASNKSRNPISEYIKSGPDSSNTPTKSSSQSPTTVTTAPVREPQIELRMTPSQNESVVSINVDELATKTAGTKDQLSVVISSKRGKPGKVDANNLNLGSDFGSMQISISENTVPVKQIEFSINGKPVSELKSIVARADKLDVVSSMDKVEIRIPSSKDKVSSEQTKNLTRTASSSTPVLNLQIAAKFNEPRVHQPTDTSLKTTTTTTTNPSTPAPSKSKTLFTPKPTKSETSTANVPSVKRTEDVTGTKQVNTVSTFDTGASMSKQETAPNVAESSPSTVKVNDAVFHNVDSNANVPPTNPSRQPSMNIGNANTNKSPEDRTPSNMIPWWSSEESFKKIRKKRNTPKNASALVEDEMTTMETQESVNETQATEQTALSPGTASVQQLGSVDSSKIVSPVSPANDGATKKPVLDEKQKSDFADPIHRVVRVRSPQRRVTMKPTSGIKTSKHAKRNSASSISRIGKKVKYRPKSNIVKISAVAKKEPETLTVSTPRSPKIFKYVSVNPQRASIYEEPEAPKAASPNTQMKDEQRVKVSKVEGSKVEQESKANTKVEKSVVPQRNAAQVGKANVQNSKTILKGTGLEKPANRSAGVSAESSLEFAKGREQDKADRTIEKELPRGSEAVDEVSTQRLKEILKSMKPIEKRKDGTLIDYGVTVPSRKPSGKLRQTPRVRSKTSITIDPKKVIAVPPTKLKDTPSEGKIVEPEKISSVKKETLTEPKNVTHQEKIVDAEKVSSTKKSIEAKSLETSQETRKLNKPKSKVQPKKTLTKEPSVNSLNPGDDNAMNFSKSTFSDKIKKNPLEGTVTPSRSQFPERQGSKKSVTLPEAPLKAPFEGTIVHSTRVMDKKVTSVDGLPLQGTIVFSQQKTGVKVTKNDNTLLKGSFARFEKRLGNTGSAPYKGTIEYHPRNQDSLSTVISINEKENRASDISREKQNEGSPTSNVTETPSSKRGGNTESNDTVNIPTGPAGLKSARSSTMTKVLPNDKTQHPSQGSCRKTSEKRKSDEATSFNEEPDTCVLFSSHAMRPEKDMLYSSWLQRFNNKLDDDEVV